MTRALVVGNGNILVTFDHGLNMRDFYYPMVGQLNHIGGHKSRLGVWTNGEFSWCDESSWERKLNYKKDTMVTEVEAINKKLGILIKINDAVHFSDNIYLKKVMVFNLASEEREIRVFFSQDFSICETEVGDTVLYDQELESLYHYKRNNYFLMKGCTRDSGIYQYSTGRKRFNSAEGTWRDAEDGQLSCNPIAQGSVDSTMSFKLKIPAGKEDTIYYWITAGKNFQEVKKLNFYVLQKSPEMLLKRIENYWRVWLEKDKKSFGNLPEDIIALYKKSLLIVKTQIDNRGAILAANDSDILEFNRDHYSYMWPRDGALVAYALIKAGHSEMTKEFFRFCDNSLTEGGFLLHKYNPDGSLGSSWHPWFENNEIQLPIQEDETALVLFALWEYYNAEKDLEFIQSIYRSFIRPAGNFLANYFDPNLDLPRETYDLWEERRGIFAFTCAAVYGGLIAAANFADIFLDSDLEKFYLQKANSIKAGMNKYLYDEELNRYLRGIYILNNEIQKDYTLESSLYGVFAFGLFDPKDEAVRSTMQAIEEGLWIKSEVGGIARYVNDYYFQKLQDVENIPGNPWIICTLWLADWYIEIAEAEKDLVKPLELIKWAQKVALSSGVLPEQVHPLSVEPLSVSPLTWSHATYVLVINKYLQKFFSFS